MKTMKMAMVLMTGLVLAAQAQVETGPAEAVPVVYPAAILSFHERGAGVKGYGSTAADILFGELVASVKGESGDELSGLVEKLAGKVAETITARASELVAKTVSKEDRLAALTGKMPEGKRRTVFVSIDERHVGQATIDPAAETEISLFAKHVGFPVLDADSATRSDADIVITGEGFSEFAMRRGNMVSVKARLEVKAVDRKTDKVLAIDRETAVVVDLTEQVAGKAALQEAAARIAERLLPKLVK